MREGTAIRKVQGFLGHEQVNTTQTYDLRAFSTKEGVSHLLPM